MTIVVLKDNFIIIWTTNDKHNTVSNRNHNRKSKINTRMLDVQNTGTRCRAKQSHTRYKSHNVIKIEKVTNQWNK